MKSRLYPHLFQDTQAGQEEIAKFVAQRHEFEMKREYEDCRQGNSSAKFHNILLPTSRSSLWIKEVATKAIWAQ